VSRDPGVLRRRLGLEPTVRKALTAATLARPRHDTSTRDGSSDCKRRGARL